MQASNDLIADVVQLPVRPGAAMRLLWMLDDTHASASDLGRLIESDPALSTQVLGLANTPFYGLAGKVTGAWRAVTVLGLATLRAVATAAAFDLFAEHGRPLPADFWPHAVTTAAGASALARRVGALPNDAFSLGLLHDIGTALVCRRAPQEFDRLVASGELEATHAHIAGSALSVMRFPADMVEAIAEHHAAPDAVPSSLSRLLIAADAIALAIDESPHETNVPLDTALDALGVPASAADALIDEVRAARAQLADFPG
jgi:putative nucleotidyltransferase with HDIG domain